MLEIEQYSQGGGGGSPAALKMIKYGNNTNYLIGASPTTLRFDEPILQIGGLEADIVTTSPFKMKFSEAGIYEINFHIAANSGTAWAGGDAAEFGVFKNGVKVSTLAARITEVANTYAWRRNGTATDYFAVNDELEIKYEGNRGVDVPAASWATFIEVIKRG